MSTREYIISTISVAVIGISFYLLYICVNEPSEPIAKTHDEIIASYEVDSFNKQKCR